MPVVEGLRPVIKLVRDGLHKGAWQWALVKVVPFAAKRSMYGVFTCGCPLKGATQSFKSSMAIKRIFGFSAAPVGEVERPNALKSRITIGACFISIISALYYSFRVQNVRCQEESPGLSGRRCLKSFLSPVARQSQLCRIAVQEDRGVLVVELHRQRERDRAHDFDRLGRFRKNSLSNLLRFSQTTPI